MGVITRRSAWGIEGVRRGDWADAGSFDCCNERWQPGSLRSVAGAPECGAEEKPGHSSRDDSVGERTQDGGLKPPLHKKRKSKEGGNRRGCTTEDTESTEEARITTRGHDLRGFYFAGVSASFRMRTWPLEWNEPPVAVFASCIGFCGRKCVT
jgi:hypothetical protein